jgi:hypothetical protein
VPSRGSVPVYWGFFCLRKKSAVSRIRTSVLGVFLLEEGKCRLADPYQCTRGLYPCENGRTITLRTPSLDKMYYF